MGAIFKIEQAWNTHISTAKLNRWLGAVIEQHPPPAVSGRRIKMRYMTQAKMRPPSFIVFGNRADDVPMSYQRYLINSMRETFEHARHTDPAVAAIRQEPLRQGGVAA